MLHKGSGGDAGVHADHHVIGLLISRFLFLLLSRSNMAAQTSLQFDHSFMDKCLFFLFFFLPPLDLFFL